MQVRTAFREGPRARSSSTGPTTGGAADSASTTGDLASSTRPARRSPPTRPCSASSSRRHPARHAHRDASGVSPWSSAPTNAAATIDECLTVARAASLSGLRVIVVNDGRLRSDRRDCRAHPIARPITIAECAGIRDRLQYRPVHEVTATIPSPTDAGRARRFRLRSHSSCSGLADDDIVASRRPGARARRRSGGSRSARRRAPKSPTYVLLGRSATGEQVPAATARLGDGARAAIGGISIRSSCKPA